MSKPQSGSHNHRSYHKESLVITQTGEAKATLQDITADHIIDLGPEGGDGGGQVLAEGPPEKVAKVKASYTGQYLKEYL